MLCSMGPVTREMSSFVTRPIPEGGGQEGSLPYGSTSGLSPKVLKFSR